jgi:hypothetical protein
VSKTRCDFEWFTQTGGATRRRSPTAQSISRYDGAPSKRELGIGMKRSSVLWLKMFLATLTLLCSAPTSSFAADRNRDTVRQALYKSEPEYYEPSGSYFQIVTDTRKHDNGQSWELAAEAASKLTYKGRRGRLAIVNDGALYAWLLEKFEILGPPHDEHIWIGLRYLCANLTLMWVNGEEHPRSAFSYWDVPWYRVEEIRCGSGGKGRLPYMGVSINSKTSRWRATGYKKHYYRSLVEYPAE